MTAAPATITGTSHQHQAHSWQHKPGDALLHPHMHKLPHQRHKLQRHERERRLQPHQLQCSNTAMSAAPPAKPATITLCYADRFAAAIAHSGASPNDSGSSHKDGTASNRPCEHARLTVSRAVITALHVSVLANPSIKLPQQFQQPSRPRRPSGSTLVHWMCLCQADPGYILQCLTEPSRARQCLAAPGYPCSRAITNKAKRTATPGVPRIPRPLPATHATRRPHQPHRHLLQRR